MQQNKLCNSEQSYLISFNLVFRCYTGALLPSAVFKLYTLCLNPTGLFQAWLLNTDVLMRAASILWTWPNQFLHLLCSVQFSVKYYAEDENKASLSASKHECYTWTCTICNCMLLLWEFYYLHMNIFCIV